MKHLLKIILVSFVALFFSIQSAYAQNLGKELRGEFFKGMYSGCYGDLSKAADSAYADKYCKCIVDVFDTNMSDDDVVYIVDLAIKDRNFMQDPMMTKLVSKAGKCN